MMRHLIQQLNEAAGRKYYVLVGWTDKMKRWEVIFSDYDRGAVEEEQADYRTQRGDPDLSYKKLRILTVADAKRSTVDAAVDALKEDVATSKDLGPLPEGIDAQSEAEYRKLLAQYEAAVEAIKVEVPTGVGRDKVGVRVAVASMGASRWLFEVYNPNRGMAAFQTSDEQQADKVAAAAAQAFKGAADEMRKAHGAFTAAVKKL
jgi:hypothetical protein